MGETPDSFFAMTPRLMSLVAEGRARRQQALFERLAWAIHQNAALCLADPKKFPTLTNFLRPMQPKAQKRERAPLEVLESTMAQWAAAMDRRLQHEGR